MQEEWSDKRQWMLTDNGDRIKADLMVFTYDYKWGKVDADDFSRVTTRNEDYMAKGWELSSNDFWFKVMYPDSTHGTIYNGERMTTMCPNCRGDFEACDKSGCGQRKEPNWTGWNKK